MNLILFEREEIDRPLARTDPRAVHLLSILRRKEGGSFDAGQVNGPQGKGRIESIGSGEVALSFAWGPEPPPLDPIRLVIGLPRPQTARKILQEAAALGVSSLQFVVTEKGEAGYAQSTLWQSGEWKRHVRAGAEQAFTTRIPVVSHGLKLEAAIDANFGASVLALDNYEATGPLSAQSPPPPAVLAIGPERGWGAAERAFFRSRGAPIVHLGTRVLRAETACVAAVSILKVRLGLL